jgi:hypothetical protein
VGACNGINVPTTTANVPLEQRYRFDVYGNLKTQWHSGTWMAGGAPVVNGVHGKETYTYDALHRLTTATRTGADNLSNTVNYDYDAIGGLLKNLSALAKVTGLSENKQKTALSGRF